MLAQVLALQNGNPLQQSCLGNPRDKRSWWSEARGLQMAGHDSEARKQQQRWVIAEHLQTDTNGSSWHAEERVKSEVQQWDATLSTYT